MRCDIDELATFVFDDAMRNEPHKSKRSVVKENEPIDSLVRWIVVHPCINVLHAFMRLRFPFTDLCGSASQANAFLPARIESDQKPPDSGAWLDWRKNRHPGVLGPYNADV